MKPLNRRRFSALLGSAALTGCVTSPPVVTRNAPDPFEGGIGGTGIVGILTDFGSLLVNGLRVEVETRTRIATPFGAVSDSALAPGQALTITAVQSRDRLVAREVRIDHALVGRLVREAGQLSVNGVPLRMEPGAIIAAQPGAQVAVSGIWTQQGVSTTRIDPADQITDSLDTAAPDLIAGTFDPDGPSGPQIGGFPIAIDGRLPAPGSYLVARGQFDGTAMRSSLAREGRFVSGAPIEQLSVEGFLEPSQDAPGFRVAGLGHSFGPALNLGALASRRAIYFGPYDGLFQAASGYVMPNNFERRRTLLRDGISEADGDVIRTL